MIGFSCIWIFGVHGMLSGTAAADFGGKKAAATAAGMLDGIQYVAAGLTGFGLGWLLKTYGWGVWTLAIIPFSLIGAAVISRLWTSGPARWRIERGQAFALRARRAASTERWARRATSG